MFHFPAAIGKPKLKSLKSTLGKFPAFRGKFQLQPAARRRVLYLTNPTVPNEGLEQPWREKKLNCLENTQSFDWRQDETNEFTFSEFN